MTLQSYVWGLRLGTLTFLGALIFVVSAIDPQTAGIVGFVLFYATLFLFFMGLYILMFTGLWRRLARDGMTTIETNMSFRQGVLLALLTTILIFFQQLRILVWWDALLVTAGILLIELYFLSS